MAPRPARVLSRCLALVASGCLLFGAAPQASAAPERTLDERFAGAVGLGGKKGDVVTLRYDFSDQKQLADWETGAPFRIIGEDLTAALRWFDGKIEVPAKKGIRHVAQWTGDVTVTATLRADVPRDVGTWFAPVSGANDYVTYSFVETYFHKWDNNPGGNHSIIQFGDQWREGPRTEDDSFVGFRYISRRPHKDELKPGEPVTLTARWVKDRFEMEAFGDDLELAGKPKGPPLEDLTLGFYTVPGRLLVDDIEITGRLCPAWLAKEGVALRVAEGAADGGLDPELQQLVDDHVAGQRRATRELVKRLRASVATPAVHEALVGALSQGPRQTVRAVLELLYDGDVAIRTAAITIVKAHLGKDYGYRPKGKERSRGKAIKRLNAALDKNPRLLDD